MVHVVWGLIITCGKEEQLDSGVDTAFLNLGGKPVLSYAIDAFENCPDVDGIAVVCVKDRMSDVQQMVRLFGYTKIRRIAAGTNLFVTSVKAGLKSFDEMVSIVVIHEATRPLIRPDIISETIKSGKRYGCAIVADKIVDPVKIVEKGYTVARTSEPNAWVAQSPFCCRLEIFNEALGTTSKDRKSARDFSEAVELCGNEVRVVPSNPFNFKIRTARDLEVADSLLRVN